MAKTYLVLHGDKRCTQQEQTLLLKLACLLDITSITPQQKLNVAIGVTLKSAMQQPHAVY